MVTGTKSEGLKQRTRLKKKWGRKFKANTALAIQAVSTLKVAPSIVREIEKEIGYAKTIELFFNIGRRICQK